MCRNIWIKIAEVTDKLMILHNEKLCDLYTEILETAVTIRCSWDGTHTNKNSGEKTILQGGSDKSLD